MIIKEKIGSLQHIEIGSRRVERINLQWYEAAKKILHTKTDLGREVILKYFNGEDSLQQDDVVYADNETLICIDIIPVKAIVCKPASMREMAYLCYEIGNKHLPLFYENDALAMPYDEPVFKMLTVAGCNPAIENRKLLQQMKTSVSPHGHVNSVSLFSKILQLTSTKDES